MNRYSKQINTHTYTPPICQCSDLASAVSGPSVWLSIRNQQLYAAAEKHWRTEGGGGIGIDEERYRSSERDVTEEASRWRQLAGGESGMQNEYLWRCVLGFKSHYRVLQAFRRVIPCSEELMTDIIRVMNHREISGTVNSRTAGRPHIVKSMFD